MERPIYTRYSTDSKGRGKVTAKCNGRQRTVAYDPAKSIGANHGAAAGVLANDVLGWRATDNFNHTLQPDGTHIFTRNTEVTMAAALLAKAGRTNG